MRFLPLFIPLLLPFLSQAQQFKGQWKGEFIDKSGSNGNWGGEKCDYVLEMESSSNTISGYSYTYFSENGKQYYTICRIEGKIDPRQKVVEIREIERTKTNVPKNIQNCFQIHKLTYFKKGSEESLSGEWMPVPGQGGDCGFGETNLARRTLDNSFGNIAVRAGKNSNANISQAAASDKKSQTSRMPGNSSKSQLSPLEKNEGALNNPDMPVAKQAPKESNADDNSAQVKVTLPRGYEKRENRILKQIEVENQLIKVDLFDNGEIDGDSITLFYNNMMLVSHKRLTDKAITFTIMVDDEEAGELEMYAENLGTIAPNTAVMVVTDGNKRYETRVTSDLTKSGVIRFIRRKKS